MSSVPLRPPAPASLTADPAPPRPWPRVDRPDLVARVNAAVAGTGCVLLVGPTGIGRTSLMARIAEGMPAGRRGVGLRAVGSPPADGDSPAPDLATATAGLVGMRLVLVDDDLPVVLLDDAHRAPSASVATLIDLAVRRRIRLVAVLDLGAASTDPWLPFWREGPAERIDLPPLTPGEAADALHLFLGAPVSSGTVRQLWAASGGFPFHLRELVLGQLESGALQRRSGCWVESGPPRPSARLVEIARHELQAMADDAREALELLSLVEPMPLAHFVDLVGEDVVERLRRDALVTLQRSDPASGRPVLDVRLVPAVFSDAVRDVVPPGRRRRLLARTSRLPAPAPHPEGDLRRLVSALECGIAPRPDEALAAMGTALALDLPDVALRLGDAALVVLAQASAEGEETPVIPGHALAARIRLLRAGAWRLLGRRPEAAQELAVVSHLLARPLPASTRRTLTLRWVEAEESLRFHGGDTAGALAVLDRFRAEVAGDEATSAFVRLARLERLADAGMHRQALPESLAVLDDGVAPACAARLVPGTVMGLAEQGLFGRALDVLRRHGNAASSRTDGPWQATRICLSGILAHLWSGDVEAARRFVTEGFAAPAPSQTPIGDLAEGLLAAASGLWTQADRALGCAAARLEVADPVGAEAFVLAARALAAAALGEPTRAEELAARARGVPLRIAAAVASQVRLFLLDAEIWSRGTDVAERAQETVAWAASAGLPRAELEALHRLAFVTHCRQDGVESGVVERMRRIADAMPGAPRPAALLAHAEAMAAADDPFVLVAARELAGVGVWLPTASPGVGLTRREQEIAGLAAGGLTSKAIGERLTLSVRTVDSHLARVFVKLGVHSRHELRAVVRSAHRVG